MRDSRVHSYFQGIIGAGQSLGLDALLSERRIFAPGSRAAALVHLAS